MQSCDAYRPDAQPLRQPDRLQAALAGPLRPSASAGRLRRTLGITMKKLFLLLFFVAQSAQAAFFAPDTVNHKPTAEERTNDNGIKSEALCKTKHGKWFEEKGYYAYCVLSYADAGKTCKNSKDCIGHCIAPLTDDPLDHGTCQEDDSTDDCGRPHYENGKVIYFNCD
jgi:hypothetical protein